MKKILYDIEQLIMANGKETGICRVSLEVLHAIEENNGFDVYPLVTTNKGCDAGEYLTSKGLGSLANKVVYMPHLKKTTQKHNLYKAFCSYVQELKYKKKYLRELNKYDEYISIFSPISPIVYSSNLKTKLIVHDLIPIKFPQYCAKKFVHKYKCWVQAIKADNVICVSEATKQDFLYYRPDYKNKDVNVVYLAASDKFSPQSAGNIKQKYNINTEKYILSVSDHNPRKNFTHLIDAFAKFLDISKATDISLAIVGPKARDSENIKNIIEKHSKYKDKIIITGFVDDKDMPALYSTAEMFVFPSLYEGFGLPILEAMKCGTPVISSNNSSLLEVGGNAPLYISGTDIEETAKAIEHLYIDEKICNDMKEKGFKQAQKFNWAQTSNDIFNL